LKAHEISARVAVTTPKLSGEPQDSQIVAIFCLCDDILKRLHHHENKQCKMSDAEVMTTSIVAAVFFGGNMETTCTFLEEQGYVPKMLGKRCFNYRQHRIADLFLTVFNLLAAICKELNEQSIYVLDSFPVAVCDNYRIPRSRRYTGEIWCGCQASKKCYFYG